MMHFASRFSTLMVAAAMALAGCSDSIWDPPVPGSILVERSSPDESLLARIIAAEIHGTYTLEVRDTRKGDMRAQRTIAAPVGYHSHIVSVAWSEDGRVVRATIDYDFGDNNRVFDLRPE